MVLEKYTGKEAPKFLGQNALDDMKMCKLIVDLAKRESSTEEFKMEKRYLNKLLQAAQDYTHYRDVAIRFGEDVSGLPKKLNVGWVIK